VREQLAILRVPDFRRLFTARTVSTLGSAVAPVALAFAVLDLPGATPSTLGIVLTAQALPEVLFMLLGGVVADRFPRNRVMVLSDLVAGAAQIALGFLFITQQATLPLLVVLAALNGVATALFFPAITGLLPQVVAEHQLQPANGLLRLAMNVARIVGTALAGVMVYVVGSGPTLLVDGGTFLLSAAALIGVRVAVADREPSGVVADLREGWREFVSRQWVWVIVLSFALINLAAAATFGVLGPVQAKAHYGGASGWAAIVAVEATGTVVGVLLAIRIRPRRPLVVATLSTMALVAPMGLLAIQAPLWTVMVGAFLSGISFDVFGVLWDTALQRHVPQDVLSRVSSYDWLGSLVLAPVGLALAGPTAAAFGIGGALWGCAGIVALSLTAALLSPQVRRLKDEPRAAQADA